MKLCECGCGKPTKIATRTRRGDIKGQPQRLLHGHGRHKGTVEQRFWSRVNKNGPMHPVLKTRCWLWTGCTSAEGYGIVNTGDGNATAQRMSWFLTYGKWPKYLACHHCDNPPCVRPDHLFDGPHRANTDDMLAKGRFPIGERHWFAKLTDKEVEEMREKRSNGTLHRVLAAEYGVTRGTVSRIISGKRRQPKETTNE